MKLSIAAILLLSATATSHAFTQPKPTMTIAPAARGRLQYVRHDGTIDNHDQQQHNHEMGWLHRMEEAGHQQREQQYQNQQARQRTFAASSYNTSSSSSSSPSATSLSAYASMTFPPPPPSAPTSRSALDYEDRVNARFSRHHRRERLRQAISYGAELDLQRREMQQANHRRHLLEVMQAEEHHDHADAYEARWLAHQNQMDRQLHRDQSVRIPQLLANTPIPIINFRTNSDFPASKLPASRWVEMAYHPLPFEDATYSQCVRTNAMSVLVPCDDPLIAIGNGYPTVVLEDGVTYMVETVDDVIVQTTGEQQHEHVDRAYWLQTKLRDAIYGQVRYGTILHRLSSPVQVMLPRTQNNGEPIGGESSISVEWIATHEAVAIKEMSWEHIRTEGPNLAEDPIKEVSAMQYLKKWVDEEGRRTEAVRMLRQIARQDDHQPMVDATMDESHIMMPLDLLSDDINLYSITPFCTGGRLLDILEGKSRFSEPEARYWMRQILQGLSYLKKAGVTHRDMSPENLMVHDGNVYIIDMGMCLRIPAMDGGEIVSSNRKQQRSLILPQSPCGKWYYLSPEVLLSEQPFDGPAVDLWAAGVILFIMLTGLPPWEEPKMTDENFKLMSTGYLVQILTDRRVGLSADAMDLLQRMFWLDPADRLSLDQVLAHPWMTHKDNLTMKNKY